MRRRTRKISAITGVVAFAIIGFHGITRAIEADVESAYQKSWDAVLVSSEIDDASANTEQIKCQPTVAPGIEIELVGEVESERGLYRMWFYDSPNGDYATDVTVKWGEACGLAFTRYDEAITNRVPLEIARSLTLQLYREAAKVQGGVEQYSANMSASFAEAIEHNDGYSYRGQAPEDPRAEITSVQAWAFGQLGIELPEGSYRIRDIDNAWQYE